MPSLTVRVISIITATCSAILQIISGVVLVGSVGSIRQFYRDNNIENQLNSRTILIHSSAFILYLVTSVFYVIIWDIYLVSPYNRKVDLIWLLIYTT